MAANVCVDESFDVDPVTGELSIARCGDGPKAEWPFDGALQATDNGLHLSDSCGMWVAPFRTMRRFTSLPISQTPGGSVNTDGAEISGTVPATPYLIHNPHPTLAMNVQLNIHAEWHVAVNNACLVTMKYGLSRDVLPTPTREIGSWYRPTGVTTDGTARSYVGTYNDYTNAEIAPLGSANFYVNLKATLNDPVGVVTMTFNNWFHVFSGVSFNVIPGGDV